MTPQAPHAPGLEAVFSLLSVRGSPHASRAWHLCLPSACTDPLPAMGALAECLSNVSCRTEAANFKPSPSLTVISMFCVF